MWIGLLHWLQCTLSSQCLWTKGSNNQRTYFNYQKIPSAAQKSRGYSYQFCQRKVPALTRVTRPKATMKRKYSILKAAPLLLRRNPLCAQANSATLFPESILVDISPFPYGYHQLLWLLPDGENQRHPCRAGWVDDLRQGSLQSAESTWSVFGDIWASVTLGIPKLQMWCKSSSKVSRIAQYRELYRWEWGGWFRTGVANASIAAGVLISSFTLLHTPFITQAGFRAENP